MYGQKNKNRTSALPGTGPSSTRAAEMSATVGATTTAITAQTSPLTIACSRPGVSNANLNAPRLGNWIRSARGPLRLASRVTTSGTTITTSARIVAGSTRSRPSSPEGMDRRRPFARVWVRES